MEAYKRWVRRNKEYVHSLESLANNITLDVHRCQTDFGIVRAISGTYEGFPTLLKGMTWLLPERFSESEIGPEAVTAVLGIITAINEHIIDTAPTQTNTGFVEPNSFPYSLCISALKDLENVVEVAAQHYYGDNKKWNFISATEAIKVLVRLAMLRKSGYKMLLQGGETPNDKTDDGSSTSQQRIGNLGKESYLRNGIGQNPWNLEGRAMSALSRFGQNARMVSDSTWLNRANQQLADREPPVANKPTLSTIWSESGLRGALFVIGEVLFITRPLLYVLFIRKYGIKSWTPWCFSLGLDVVSMSIVSQVTESAAHGDAKKIHLSSSEKDEVKRRKLLFALYIMRDPFFNTYTRRRLEETEKVLEPVPILGFLTEKIIELIKGAQTRYTYMSGS